MVQQTPTNQDLDANNSINRLADAIAGITTQQRPRAATTLKPVSTITLIFDGKNEKFELFEDLFHTMLKMQPEMTEATKTNHFHAHLRKEAFQTFRNISAANKRSLDDVLNVFRQYIISDPPPTVYHSHQTLNTGIPSVVWQQQMEKAYIRRYNNMHIVHKTLATYEYDYTDNFDTHFRPLPEVVAYDPYFVDPQYGFDPYWDEEIYNQDKLEYKDTYNKPNDQIESDDLITDSHVSDALRYAVIDLWTVNPQLPDTSPLPNFRPRPQNQQRQIAVIDDQILPQLQVTPDGLTRFLPLSTKLPLKNKQKMLYFPMDFGELNIDGLIDTGALSSAIPEVD